MKLALRNLQVPALSVALIALALFPLNAGGAELPNLE